MACKFSQKSVKRELNIQKKAVYEWFSCFRDICFEYLEINSEMIGGIDEKNDPIIVEIDELFFFHRKYNRGAIRKGVWVFGGIERHSGSCFLTTVSNRSQEILFPIIQSGSYLGV